MANLCIHCSFQIHNCRTIAPADVLQWSAWRLKRASFAKLLNECWPTGEEARNYMSAVTLDCKSPGMYLEWQQPGLLAEEQAEQQADMK